MILPAFLLLSLQIFQTVPDFTLVSETGRRFQGRELEGKVWVANFVFTNCAGPCPRMTNEMRKVQDATPQSLPVRFVSFTVDPDRDTPEVLAAYARRFKADPERWRFLTGPMSELHNLKRNVFLLGDVDGKLEHTTKFALIDQHMRIRGYYDTADDIVLAQLIRDTRNLATGPLPTVNAALNGTAAVLLVLGYVLIRRGRREAHKKVMLAAFAISVAFLISYLVYHNQVGSVRFLKTGPIRAVYLSILLSHTILASAVPFLAAIALYRAWRGRFDAHRRVARWTLPLWLYVSVTGVVVYLMLYHL